MDQEGGGRSGGWLDHANPLVRWGGRAWLLLGLLLVAWAVWQLAGHLRIVLFPLMLAIFPAAVLQPVVDGIDRLGAPRSLAALAATLGFFLALLGVLALLAWQITTEFSDVAGQLGSAWDDLRSALQDLPVVGDIDPSALLGGGSDGGGGSESGGSGTGGGGGIGGIAASLAEGTVRFVAELFLGIVALFFYLRDGDRIGAWLVGLFPLGHQEDARTIGGRSWDTVSGYIRGQTLVALFDGTLFAIGLLIVGVPMAIALGVIVFLGAFVPTVGSVIAGAIAVLVALVSEGLATALITLALIVGIQQLEGNVLAPVVLGREVELHPLAILAAITAGAAVLGPFGAIVAVPLAASVYHAASYVRAEVA